MEFFIGQIKTFPYNFAPEDWILCQGSLLSIDRYPQLYSLIGCTYGGDGHTNFRVPDLMGAEPDPNVKYYIALSGVFPSKDEHTFGSV